MECLAGFAPKWSKRRVASIALVFAGFVSAMLSPSLTSAQVPPSERAVLINLFNTTNGTSWTRNDNWCSGTCPASGAVTFNAAGTECTWFGIVCDATTPLHVNNMYLSSNNLAGSLPDLSPLTRLGRIELSNNSLTGTISQLTGMPQLGVFIAGGNQFDGQIPKLKKLPNLVIFYVDRNQLTGPIPDLTGLRLLGFDVSNNLLTGSVPTLPQPLIANPWIRICPNPLDTTPSANDAGWSTYTGYDPWWATPYPNNECDDIFTGQFEYIPLPPPS